MANQTKFGETSFGVGDTIKVYYKVIESEKVSGVKKKEQKEEVHERFQPFEGIVLSISQKSFTVRKIAAANIGVERIFPKKSPWIQKIVVVKKAEKVRRAKLYFLRNEKTGLR